MIELQRAEENKREKFFQEEVWEGLSWEKKGNRKAEKQGKTS